MSVYTDLACPECARDGLLEGPHFVLHCHLTVEFWRAPATTLYCRHYHKLGWLDESQMERCA